MWKRAKNSWQGSAFSWKGLTYKFTGLNSIKPDMITEATRNARAAAERFALDSGSKVGSIRQANQGVFSILPADQTSDASEPGEFGPSYSSGDSSLMKTVRVVTSVEYYLEKWCGQARVSPTTVNGQMIQASTKIFGYPANQELHNFTPFEGSPASTLVPFRSLIVSNFQNFVLLPDGKLGGAQ